MQPPDTFSGVFKARRTCLVAVNVVFSARRANNSHLNPLTGFEKLLRSAERGEGEEGRGREKEEKERKGRQKTFPGINF